MAWWEGEPNSVRHQARQGSVSADTARPEMAVELDQGELLPYWTSERIAACELLWGAGFVQPGGEAYLKRILTPAKLEVDDKVLDLTTGLGGTTELMQRLLGCEVQSLDPSEELADIAAKKLDCDVKTYDPQDLVLERRNYGKFNCIVNRDAMFAADKDKMLDIVSGRLQPQGSFVFTDFVMAEERVSGPEVQAWQALEPVSPQLWTMDEYRLSLLSRKFRVHVFQDESEVLIRLVKAGWRACVDRLESERLSRGLVNALVLEADLWLHRIRALESGQLRYVLVHAQNPERKIRQLSA